MNILNTSKQEKIFLNKARIKILKKEPEINKINYSEVVNYVLKVFIGGQNRKRIKTKN